MVDLLICEEQPMVLRGLQKLTRSFGLPIGEIYLAENGEQGLELFRDHDIHLVITDIRMPGCSGLELLSRLRRLRSDLQVVIISAYDDFSYAKTAIELGVEAYLLKPVDSAELQDALSRCLENLTRNVSRKQILSELLLDQIREVWGPDLPEKTAARLRTTNDSLFHAPSFSFLTFYCPRKTASQEEVMEEAERFLSGFFSRVLVFPVYRNSFCAVVNLSPAEQESLPAFSAALEEFAGSAGPLYCGLGPVGDSVFDLKEIALKSEAALNNRFGSPERLLFTPESPKPCTPLVKSEVLAVTGSLCNDLRLPEVAAVEKDLTALFKKFSQSPGAVQVLPDSLRRIGSFIRTELGEGDEALSLLEICDGADSLEVLEGLLRAGLMELCRKRLQLQWVKRDAVSQSIEYMENNYAKPLTLAILANVVSLNYTYFSSIFKNKTGVSVTAYLQALRIRKAKELLISSDGRICDIAHRTGFTDERYFEKLFKRHEGITPSEYRNQMTSGVDESGG